MSPSQQGKDLEMQPPLMCCPATAAPEPSFSANHQTFEGYRDRELRAAVAVTWPAGLRLCTQQEYPEQAEVASVP
jgi:hypothetical protein